MKGTTPASFEKEFSHPELGDALSIKSSGKFAGPDPVASVTAKKEEPGSFAGSKVKDSSFVSDASYMGPGNKELQKDSVKVVSLESFTTEKAKI